MLYAGITGRFTRVLEALEIEFNHKATFKLILEADFRDLFAKYFTKDEKTCVVDDVIAANPKIGGRPSARGNDPGHDVHDVLTRLLYRLVEVPETLIDM